MYMIVTIPFTIPATWFIDRLGVRMGVSRRGIDLVDDAIDLVRRYPWEFG